MPGLSLDPGVCKAAAELLPRRSLAPPSHRQSIPEDYEEAAASAIVGMGRDRTQEADRAVGAVGIYQGVARGAGYPFH